jgi:hypothetical protein
MKRVLACLLALVAAVNARAQEAPLTPETLNAWDRSALRQLGAYGLRQVSTGRVACEASPPADLAGPGVTVCDPRTGKDLTRAEMTALFDGKALAPATVEPPPDARPRAASPSAALAVLKGGAFEPKGPLPAGEYSGSLRGPAMAGDGTAVTPAGRITLGAGVRADNFLTRESGPRGSVLQKFENQVATLDLRRGVSAPLPTEIGVQVRIIQRDEGLMNGFISGWEHMTARAFGNQGLINPNRSGPGAVTGIHDEVTVGGRSAGDSGAVGPRLGDVTVGVKTALIEAVPGSFVTSLAARAAVNLAVGGPFSNGPWAGVGLSAQRRIAGKLYANADLRVTQPLEARDSRGLTVGRSVGTTVGLEYGVNDKTSVGIQLDSQSSPYRNTGVHALDDRYSDVTFGVSRVATLLGQKAVLRFWGKEDFNTAAKRGMKLAPHGDTDFQAGASITVTR